MWQLHMTQHTSHGRGHDGPRRRGEAGRGGKATTAMCVGELRAARVPEQRGSGFSAATPPRSFTVGSCFFNGGTGGFFSSSGQSPVGQSWNS